MRKVEPKKIRAARALRQRETDLEYRLWRQLRNRRFAKLKFRRQHPIGPYVADFACPAAKLVIEIDGPWHEKRLVQDAARTEKLRTYGYDVVRFSIDDGTSELTSLIEAIVQEVRTRLVAD